MYVCMYVLYNTERRYNNDIGLNNAVINIVICDLFYLCMYINIFVLVCICIFINQNNRHIL